MLKQRLFIILSCLLSLMVLSACTPKKTINVEQAQEFAKVYKEQLLTWRAGYLILSVTGLDPEKQATPLASANAILDRYVKGFYIALNSNSKAEFKDGEFIAPHFAKFKFAAQICQIAQTNPEEMNKITQNTVGVEDFCRDTVFYYRLMVESFTSDQVASLNAWSMQRLISKEHWVKIQDGDYGFTYALPTVADLTNSNLEPYVSK
ncbi:hypothetical protein [Psittacicella gerlachiana]|uniref:Lipoprotein n=1 Tax=Psittacicella gerlachiana TaxID=2028574 RepID=A0A3A1YGA7_9GAMM|nr:hypothetical protein [Psittacicella gerlachiana]RIY36218.1 hypothetical protein CKF59_02835 [Psittacicella gerlachiana]